MKIPFIDLQSQYQSYKEEIDSAIHAVLDSSQYIMGPSVKELESNLSKYTGAKHAIACASGTDALLIALLAIGIKPGDEIITTPFTFISSSEVISLLGAIPVFVDIEEDTYNINAYEIEDKITDRTKAIMPVSLYGQTADMDVINDIASRNNLIQNSKITDEMKDFFKNVPIGSKLYFEDIMCTEPSGRKMNLGELIITID